MSWHSWGPRLPPWPQWSPWSPWEKAWRGAEAPELLSPEPPADAMFLASCARSPPSEPSCVFGMLPWSEGFVPLGLAPESAAVGTPYRAGVMVSCGLARAVSTRHFCVPCPRRGWPLCPGDTILGRGQAGGHEAAGVGPLLPRWLS